jgi:hypothetical protein
MNCLKITTELYGVCLDMHKQALAPPATVVLCSSALKL